MKNIKLCLSIFIVGVFLTGCSIKGTPYTGDFKIINEIKESDLVKINVSSTPNFGEYVINLRGSSMTSPYGGSFNNYLERALEENLKLADLYDSKSNYSIKPLLIKNEIDAWSFGVGKGSLGANIKISKKDEILFDKDYFIEYSWESSFVGAIAIPNAVDAYPKGISKLISEFLSDKELLKIITKK